MEKIKNLIHKIQQQRKENRISSITVEQIFKEIENLIREIFQEKKPEKDIFLRDLEYFFKNRPKILTKDWKAVEDYSRILIRLEDLLESILYDFELKKFIDYHKVCKDIDDDLLNCYETICKLCNFYFLMLCESHYIHRSGIEKIVKILEHNEILLIQKLDLNLNIETKPTMLIGHEIGAYYIGLNELEIKISMKIDSILGIVMDYKGYNIYRRLQISPFLEFIKIQLLAHRHQASLLRRNEIELFLDIATEDDFTNIFLVPLFRKMGFKKVFSKGHEDKTNEYGQDIRLMKLELPTENYLYFVTQVKTGLIGSSSKQPNKEIEGVLSEIRPAFNKYIFDPDISRKVKPDHVYLISSGRIGEQAQNYLYEQIDTDLKRNLLILERKQLIELFFKFGIPIINQEEIKEYLRKKNEDALK